MRTDKELCVVRRKLSRRSVRLFIQTIASTKKNIGIVHKFSFEMWSKRFPGRTHIAQETGVPMVFRGVPEDFRSLLREFHQVSLALKWDCAGFSGAFQ